MRRFDYHFLQSEVPSNIVGLTGVIEDLRAREAIRKQQYADVSVRTVELALSRLQKEGKIEKIGSFKDARYRKR